VGDHQYEWIQVRGDEIGEYWWPGPATAGRQWSSLLSSSSLDVLMWSSWSLLGGMVLVVVNVGCVVVIIIVGRVDMVVGLDMSLLTDHLDPYSRVFLCQKFKLRSVRVCSHK
jgi:hypothetical protein